TIRTGAAWTDRNPIKFLSQWNSSGGRSMNPYCLKSPQPMKLARNTAGRQRHSVRSPASLDARMTELLFYHLHRQPLEKVLPTLLEKSLERGWRVVVQAASPERVEALDAHLWTYSDDSFLPHGTTGEPQAPEQPILLTADSGNPNGANVRF